MWTGHFLTFLFSVEIVLIHCSPKKTVKSLVHVPALRVCSPGPKITDDETHSIESQRKCLIVGDSISIGYTPDVKKAIHGKCTVYHAPWDISDGGALDTKHGIHCLRVLESSSTFNHMIYDVIVFNFGLHDVDCDQMRPEEFTSLEQYTNNMKLLKKHFLRSNAKVAYALTTPVLDDCDVNKLVVKYNQAANDVMTEEPKVEVVDLYKVVVDRCGEVLRHSKKIDCPFTNDSLIPHYTPLGYRLLAKYVTEALEKLLDESTENENGSALLRKEDKVMNDEEIETSEIVYCTKHDTIRSACPPKSICVPNKMSGSGFACCLSENAVDCKTEIHCCPMGTKCSKDCTRKKCTCVSYGSHE